MQRTIETNSHSTTVLAFIRTEQRCRSPRFETALTAKRITPRQRDVLLSLLKGKSNKEIARDLRSVEATVKIHMKTILIKLGNLENRTQATMWALQNGYKPEQSADLGNVRLTEHEIELLKLLADGRSNSFIADVLDIQESTVKVELKAIFRKIQVNNRTRAAIWAVMNGYAYQRMSA